MSSLSLVQSIGKSFFLAFSDFFLELQRCLKNEDVIGSRQWKQKVEIAKNTCGTALHGWAISVVSSSWSDPAEGISCYCAEGEGVRQDRGEDIP